MLVRSVEDVDRYIGQVRKAAADVHSWITKWTGEPLDMLKHMKFDPIGYHPIMYHRLNLVEQINQTWTFLVALAAAKQLLELHPDAGGLHLTPGADASRALDIMSQVDGLVGAETFAAVDPANNDKLREDRKKLLMRPEQHRYIFFMSPKFPGAQRLPRFERGGVQVWSVDV